MRVRGLVVMILPSDGANAFFFLPPLPLLPLLPLLPTSLTSLTPSLTPSLTLLVSLPLLLVLHRYSHTQVLTLLLSYFLTLLLRSRKEKKSSGQPDINCTHLQSPALPTELYPDAWTTKDADRTRILLQALTQATKLFTLQTVGIEPTLLRTRALSVRLNRSAKSAILTVWKSHP